MSDRLATSPGGGRWHTGGGSSAGHETSQSASPASSGRVINEQVAASGFMWQLVSCSSHPHCRLDTHEGRAAFRIYANQTE